MTPWQLDQRVCDPVLWLVPVTGVACYAWELAHSRIDMGDAPTWIAAVATVAAAVFAALAARAAWQQLTSQAEE
ncbi:hypothetical protein [Streptacidiphilus anmyonensis]|uniref:hypothetical protein n=1 Tax=Streptacidiphilus anmyonensis TaxID=405782 RepID=UPI0005A6D0DF|nr:hypothetical protein [Streptacidiphilus anmyonensis]